MTKRVLALMTALALLLGCAAAESTSEPAEGFHEIEMKPYPFYLFESDNRTEDFPLYFVDDAADFPFVELFDWVKILNQFFPSKHEFAGYQVTAAVADAESQTVVLERENGSVMACDFTNGTVVFSDPVAFRQDTSGLYINLGSVSSVDPNSPDVLCVTNSRERRGNSMLMKLRENYAIPMIAQDGKYLMPLQTLSFLTLSRENSAAFFNQEALIIADVSRISHPDKMLLNKLYTAGMLTNELWIESRENTKTFQERLQYILEAIGQTEDGRNAIETYREQLQQSLGAVYYAGPTGNRSAALSAYGYSELCMELDYTYGLKEEHGVQSFAHYLNQAGLTQKLFDPDAAAADGAIGELTEYWLDDGHSGFDANSYLVGYTGSTWDTGFSMSQSGDLYETVAQIRQNYPDAVLPYYEVGDTAYITFDVFDIDPSIRLLSDYYALDEQGALPQDTIGLLITAHREITRENSPIENVVMDLSMNSGGTSPAAVFAICWFLGDAQVSAVDPLSGAESTVSYRADLNLDHRFDEYDSLSGLNLFCLISPESFSCGNLVPWAFKEDGRVTLLGKTTGGGSCVVRQLSTAWGTAYQISGDIRISFVKNGAYYNVDKGVDPDCFIRSYNDFFDREALTAYIHELR